MKDDGYEPEAEPVTDDGYAAEGTTDPPNNSNSSAESQDLPEEARFLEEACVNNEPSKKKRKRVKRSAPSDEEVQRFLVHALWLSTFSRSTDDEL